MSYLPASEVAPCRLNDLQQGQLFQSVHESAEQFLAGQINGQRVFIILGSEKPFETAEPKDWSRGAGMVVSNVRFEVDPVSVTTLQIRTTPPPGRFIVGRNGMFIVGKSRANVFEVCVSGDEAVDLQDGDLAFARWRIVTGPEDSPTALFSSGESAYNFNNV